MLKANLSNKINFFSAYCHIHGTRVSLSKIKALEVRFYQGNYRTILYKREGAGRPLPSQPPTGVNWIGVSEGSKSQGGIVGRACCM